MESDRFDIITARLAAPLSRRTSLRLLSALGLTGAVAGDVAAKKKKKSTLCLNGQTITTSSKTKRKKLLKQGARPGACVPPEPPPPGPPSCATNAECGASAICANGACQTCSVTCNGTSAVCGAALQQRLDQGGTVYVCPGRYAGRFIAGTVTVIGAGAGDDPATNTILDAQGAGRTLSLNAGVTTTLARLRITGGAAGGSSGGGVYSQNSDLTIDGCVITGNSAQAGGGIFMTGGRLEGSATSVTQNIATTYSGGGFFFAGLMRGSIANWQITDNKALSTPGPAWGGGGVMEGADVTVTRSEILRNESTSGGGGFAVYGPSSSLTLDSATRILNNKANGGSGGGGILSLYGGKVTQNGVTMSGNIPDNYKSIS